MKHSHHSKHILFIVVSMLLGCGGSSFITTAQDDNNSNNSLVVTNGNNGSSGNTGGTNNGGNGNNEDSNNTDGTSSQGNDNSGNSGSTGDGTINTGGSNASNTFNSNDYDNDGIINQNDNCPGIYNPNQTDANINQVGDICESDASRDHDGDGIANRLDNCKAKSNPDQKDSDLDGRGDVCDKKPNETHQELIAKCRGNRNQNDWNKMLQKDIDRDGLPDACEKNLYQDIDGDGVINVLDNCVRVANPAQQDSDNDKLGDLCDAVDDIANPFPDPIIKEPFKEAGAKYRYQTTYLFQAMPAKPIPAQIKDSPDYQWTSGATRKYVDRPNGWTWDNLGGDYLDKNKVRMGKTPWATVQTQKDNTRYAIHVTKMLQFIQTHDRWNAILLKNVNGYPKVKGKYSEAPPVLSIEYMDGSKERLTAYYTMTFAGKNNTNTTFSINDILSAPVALEFDRPKKTVKKAQLNFTITKHYSAKSFELFVLDPPINKEPVQNGLASKYGSLDKNLENDPSVIGIHRYIDGSHINDFVFDKKMQGFNSRYPFDPKIYGFGEEDLTKFPHVGKNKWVYSKELFTMELVDSSYQNEGFKPLAPGLGAIKVQLKAQDGLHKGYLQGDYGGTSAMNAKIFMPPEEFGYLDHIFVRYYVRLGTPYITPGKAAVQVYNHASQGTVWNNFAGKFGIAPSHATDYGGVSGSSGGGSGWQFRYAWENTLDGIGGPSENAINLGLHTYDFQKNNPPGHNYYYDSREESSFGQKGGMGGVIYPGKWYCIEMELKLNSLDKDPANWVYHEDDKKKKKPFGFKPDGEVRVWIDGRLAFERKNAVFRSWPLVDFKPGHKDNLSIMPPIRELGVRNLWWNWMHGGKTRASIDHTVFMTGLVWGKKYIGPMKK